MPLTPRSEIFIDAVQLSTDPEVYDPLDWPKRFSSFEGAGGSVTNQDFGLFAADLQATLASGKNGLLDTATVKLLQAKYRQKGVAVTVKDGVGNEFVALMRHFKPTRAFADLWRYEMTLQVVSITTLLGDAYTGS